MLNALSKFADHAMHAPFPRALRVSLAVHAFLILFAGFDIFNLFPPRPIPLPADVQVLTEKEFQTIKQQIEKQIVKKAKATEKSKPVAKANIEKKQKTASKAKVTENQTKLSTKNTQKSVKKEKIDLSNLVIQSSDDNVFDDSQLLLIEEDAEKIQQQLEEDTELLEKLSQQQDVLTASDVEDLDSELTGEELIILRAQLFDCWIPPIGAKDYENLVIRVRVDLDEQGNLQNAKILHRFGVNQSDPFYRAATESVLRAIRHPDCTPLKLPTNKYDIWKKTILTFDPTDIL